MDSGCQGSNEKAEGSSDDDAGAGIAGFYTTILGGRRPIAYYKKALSRANIGKSIYEKELMAVAMAVQHWRPYLLGRKFVVYTNQKSLRFLLEQRVTTQAQQHWIAKLLGYDFDIVY